MRFLQARKLLHREGWIMPWMTRAIACVEIFRSDTLTMQRMATKIPDNYLYLDPHLGHAVTEKLNCTGKFFVDFLRGADNEALRQLSLSEACKLPPVIPPGN